MNSPELPASPQTADVVEQGMVARVLFEQTVQARRRKKSEAIFGDIALAMQPPYEWMKNVQGDERAAHVDAITEIQSFITTYSTEQGAAPSARDIYLGFRRRIEVEHPLHVDVTAVNLIDALLAGNVNSEAFPDAFSRTLH